MGSKIRIGICGYGNLGRGAETSMANNPEMELVAVFTRRADGSVKAASGVPVVNIDEAKDWQDRIDVMLLCGGSADDLPVQGPVFAKLFNIVDSYDTHAKIPEYLKTMDSVAKAAGKVAVISAGWDPGLFSLMKLYMGAVIPTGTTYAFWGRGVSQGHSQAIRGIEGVADAVQYTLPVNEVLERIRSGETPQLSTREKHTRLCYVVAEEGADRARIQREIVEMPYYFDEYDTTVNFISMDELKADHSRMTHGGYVIHNGSSSADNSHVMEFSLKLDSNPEFTASVLLAYTRAVYRLAAKGESGARTVLDIPPMLLSALDEDETVARIL